MLRDGHFKSFESCTLNGASPVSRALVPYKQKVVVPQVWVDVVKAVMIMCKTGIPVMTTPSAQSGPQATEPYGAPLHLGESEDTEHTGMEGSSTAGLKRHSEQKPPRDSDQNRAKRPPIDTDAPGGEFVERDSDRMQETKHSQHRTYKDRKADRRERKRRKKEKKERKKRRRESRARDEGNATLVDDCNESELRAPLGNLKDSGAAKKAFDPNRVVDLTMDDIPVHEYAEGDVERKAKRLKLKHVRVPKTSTPSKAANVGFSPTEANFRNSRETHATAQAVGSKQGETIPSEPLMVPNRRRIAKKNEADTGDRVSNTWAPLISLLEDDTQVTDKTKGKYRKKHRARSRPLPAGKVETEHLEEECTDMEPPYALGNRASGEMTSGIRVSANDRKDAFRATSAAQPRTTGDDIPHLTTSQASRAAMNGSSEKSNNQAVNQDESPDAVSDFPLLGKESLAPESTKIDAAQQQGGNSSSPDDHSPALTSAVLRIFPRGLERGNCAPSIRTVDDFMSASEGRHIEFRDGRRTFSWGTEGATV